MVKYVQVHFTEPVDDIIGGEIYHPPTKQSARTAVFSSGTDGNF